MEGGAVQFFLVCFVRTLYFRICGDPPDPHSRSFFTTIPHPELLSSLSNEYPQCTQSMCIHQGLEEGSSWSRTQANSFSRQFLISNLCYVYPDYRFPFPIPHPVPRFWRIPRRFPSSGQIPYPFNKFCVFPNPAPYLGQIVQKTLQYPDT